MTVPAGDFLATVFMTLIFRFFLQGNSAAAISFAALAVGAAQQRKLKKRYCPL